MAEYDGINKIQKFIARKYFWPTFFWDSKAYMKSCNIYLTFKIIYYILYGDFKLLLLLIHHWKDFFIGFVTDLLLLIDSNGDIYDLILVIVG